MKRTKKGFEEHLAKNAQTHSKKVFIYIKRKKAVTKLVRSLNDKSLKGWGEGFKDGKASTEKLKELSALGCSWGCWGFITLHLLHTGEARGTAST